MVFQSNPMDFISWYNPSQAFTAKHVSYPRLTATGTALLANSSEDEAHFKCSTYYMAFLAVFFSELFQVIMV